VRKCLFLALVLVAACGGSKQADEPGASRELAIEVPEGVDQLVVFDGKLRTVHPRGSAPAWSPDGMQLAYLAGRSVFVDGRSVDSGDSIDLGGRLQWTPDGKALLVEWRRQYANGEIKLLPVDGGEPRFVTRGNAPAVSPDGKRVAFIRYTFGPYEGTPLIMTSALLMSSLEGGTLRVLARTRGLEGYHFFSLTWRPDGTGVVAHRANQIQGDGRLELVTLDGHRQPILPVEDFDVAPDGRIASTEPLRKEISIADADGTGIKRYPLTKKFNVSWPRGLRWSPDSEVIGFTAIDQASDSLQDKNTYLLIYELDPETGNVQRLVRLQGSFANLAWRPLRP
jgi:Tol biopolymer transport system component